MSMNLRKLRLILLGIGLAANVAAWFIIALRIPAGNGPFIIWYVNGGTLDWWGVRAELFFVPAAALLILCVNAILAAAIARKSEPWGVFVAGCTAAFMVLAAAYALSAVSVNTY